MLDRIEYGPRSECWEWLGRFNSQGRPTIGSGRDQVSTLAYRRTFLIFRGDLPEDRELDHVACDRPTCVNPWHVEPQTHAANVRRHYAQITHCVNGHEYNAENTYYRKRGNYTSRDCRACNRDRQRVRQGKKESS